MATTSIRTAVRTARGWGRHSWLLTQYRYRDYRLNAPSRRLFRAEVPSLSAAQQQILADLEARGVAFTHMDTLLQDAVRWQSLRALMESWVASEEVELAVRKYRAGESGTQFKEYIVRQSPLNARPVIPLDSPWMQLAIDSHFLDIANSYLGMRSKLHYLDLWYTMPVTFGKQTTAAQNWLRDPEDQHRILKIFLYFTDVDQGSGPLQYIPGSRRSGGKYSHLWRRVDQAYPPQQELEGRIPSSDWLEPVMNFATRAGSTSCGIRRRSHEMLRATALSPVDQAPAQRGVRWEHCARSPV